MRSVHGGDWAGFEERYHRPPLDFSVNVSPLGIPEGVRRAIVKAAGSADRYPDPFCGRLRAGIAEKEGVTMEQVLCGNGAAELIFRAVLARRPRRALLLAPTFAEYEAALRTVGCEVAYHPLREENGFALGEDILGAITPGTEMVFLCQPNNPTGMTIPRPLLLQILARCRTVGALLVLDECFCDFLDEPEKHSLTGELRRGGELLILKSFTKLYAMAGARLGYCLCGSTTLLDTMSLSGPPWSVSSLAQAAGLAALEETDYVRQVRALIRTERPWLAEELRGLGLRVIPGEANFLLFRSETPLAEPLAQKGILLRECGNYRGLDDSWYRAAVRVHEENQRLIQAIREVLTHGEGHYDTGDHVRRG